jgi:hypothetical protein
MGSLDLASLVGTLGFVCLLGTLLFMSILQMPLHNKRASIKCIASLVFVFVPKTG